MAREHGLILVLNNHTIYFPWGSWVFGMLGQPFHEVVQGCLVEFSGFVCYQPRLVWIQAPGKTYQFGEVHHFPLEIPSAGCLSDSTQGRTILIPAAKPRPDACLATRFNAHDEDLPLAQTQATGKLSWRLG